MQVEKPKMAPVNIQVVARIAVPLVALPLTFFVATASPAAANDRNADRDFGCTVRQNIEVQTVNLDPRYEGTLMEGGVGLRSAAAVRRYMTDKIRPLPGAGMTSAVGQQGGATSTGSGGEDSGAGK